MLTFQGFILFSSPSSSSSSPAVEFDDFRTVKKLVSQVAPTRIVVTSTASQSLRDALKQLGAVEQKPDAPLDDSGVCVCLCVCAALFECVCV